MCWRQAVQSPGVLVRGSGISGRGDGNRPFDPGRIVISCPFRSTFSRLPWLHSTTVAGGWSGGGGTAEPGGTVWDGLVAGCIYKGNDCSHSKRLLFTQPPSFFSVLTPWPRSGSQPSTASRMMVTMASSINYSPPYLSVSIQG